jgi:hypothetical protein
LAAELLAGSKRVAYSTYFELPSFILNFLAITLLEVTVRTAFPFYNQNILYSKNQFL